MNTHIHSTQTLPDYFTVVGLSYLSVCSSLYIPSIHLSVYVGRKVVWGLHIYWKGQISRKKRETLFTCKIIVSDDKLFFVSLTPTHIWEESLACLLKKIIASLPFICLLIWDVCLVCACSRLCVASRGRLVGTVLSTCGSRHWNSGPRAWHLVPVESSLQPRKRKF